MLDVCLLSLTSSIAVYSINHEYKEWNDKNPQVTTCNKDTKNLMQGSTVPQEVDTNKDIVFTYDVSFKVLLIKIMATHHLLPHPLYDTIS